MSIIRYIITILLCFVSVSSYQRDDSNTQFGKYSDMITEVLDTPVPPNDVNETEESYQDLEHFEGAGDGDYRQVEYG